MTTGRAIYLNLKPLDRRSPNPTIGIFGLFGSPNFGNEATLAAFLHHVRRRVPKTRFVYIAPSQSRAELEYGSPQLDLDPWPQLEALLRQSRDDATSIEDSFAALARVLDG